LAARVSAQNAIDTIRRHDGSAQQAALPEVSRGVALAAPTLLAVPKPRGTVLAFWLSAFSAAWAALLAAIFLRVAYRIRRKLRRARNFAKDS
jgi:hypothetical protein